jgi:hypothetical protein
MLLCGIQVFECYGVEIQLFECYGVEIQMFECYGVEIQLFECYGVEIQLFEVGARVCRLSAKRVSTLIGDGFFG